MKRKLLLDKIISNLFPLNSNTGGNIATSLVMGVLSIILSMAFFTTLEIVLLPAVGYSLIVFIVATTSVYMFLRYPQKITGLFLLILFAFALYRLDLEFMKKFDEGGSIIDFVFDALIFSYVFFISLIPFLLVVKFISDKLAALFKDKTKI